MESELVTQLSQLRSLYAEAAPTEPALVNEYAWLIVKTLNHETERLGSVMCRQLLADYLHLSTERPSRLHSAVLSAALRVHAAYPDFRFAAFLRLWNTANLLPEDMLPHTKDGKVYRALAERVARSYIRSLLLFPDDRLPDEQLAVMRHIIENAGMLAPQKMVVVSVSVSEVRGRRMRFVQLVSPTGVEVSCESHALHASPFAASAAGGVPPKHYVNVGQLYDVMLTKTKNAPVPGTRYRPYNVVEGYLSATPLAEVFPIVTGYVAGCDHTRNTLHIYDGLSRHFVASMGRFSREKVGDFVRFVPIVPLENAFKSAIIVDAKSSLSTEVASVGIDAFGVSDDALQSALAATFPPKQIRIVNINHQKGYLSWELLNPAEAIVESLSPYQLKRGEVSPSFIRGFISFADSSSDSCSSSVPSIPYQVGEVHNAIIFLHRGKDGQKRPFVAKVLDGIV